MSTTLPVEKRAKPAQTVRTGRPPRELAGEVDDRILQAAHKLFLRRGLAGASIDEIAKLACAGKPTIYARFPNKEALFTAVLTRKVEEKVARLVSKAPPGRTVDERLASLAAALLKEALVADNIGLWRLAIAEAPRFPHLAIGVDTMARKRGVDAVAWLLKEAAQSDALGTLPAFAPERLPGTARFFLDFILFPLVIRALLGERLQALRAEIAPHVARSVSFFLAACRHGGLN